MRAQRYTLTIYGFERYNIGAGAYSGILGTIQLVAGTSISSHASRQAHAN